MHVKVFVYESPAKAELLDIVEFDDPGKMGDDETPTSSVGRYMIARSMLERQGSLKQDINTVYLEFNPH